MPPFSGSTSLFIGEIGGSILIELMHPTATGESSRLLRFRGFSGENEANERWKRLCFGAWLHLVHPSENLSSDSSFELGILITPMTSN